jgi:hypothetical protein
LSVQFGEGEGPGVFEEGVEVVDGIEDGYEVEEGGYETDGVLGEDGFGDVGAWFGEFFGEVGYAVTVLCLLVALPTLILLLKEFVSDLRCADGKSSV